MVLENASGVFINEEYLDRNDIPRFEGWWGTKKDTRFLMKPEFEPMPNADAWQLSNAPILSVAPYLASLEMFEETGMPVLIEKRKRIVGYLEFILHELIRKPMHLSKLSHPKIEVANCLSFYMVKVNLCSTT